MNATSNDGAREQDANRDLWPLKLFLLQPSGSGKEIEPQTYRLADAGWGLLFDHYSAFRFRSNQKKKW